MNMFGDSISQKINEKREEQHQEHLRAVNKKI